jgi:hypothetical protein
MKCFDETTHDIVARGTLAWACAKMIEEPGREYANEYSQVNIFDASNGAFKWRNPGDTHWFECMGFTRRDRQSTSWHPVAPEPAKEHPAEPEPGGHDWLYSLEDGVEVVHSGYGGHFVKHGERCRHITGNGYTCSTCGVEGRLISTLPDSGWQLRRKPTAPQEPAPDPLLADTVALLERVRERIGKAVG